MRVGWRVLTAIVVLAAPSGLLAGALPPPASGGEALADTSGRVAELPAAFPGVAVAASDSLRANLWLAQALLDEALAGGVRALPPAPAPVVFKLGRRGPANPLLSTAAANRLRGLGYEVYLDETVNGTANSPIPSPKVPPGAYELRASCEEITLTYPRAGRRFGLWRQWVERNLQATVLVTVLEKDSGRLLYDERISRAYTDRVDARRFAAVRSAAYDFTDATVPESGWRRRAEETVVIGTLIGLVAVYFANTGG